ncbi:hypothetical protein JCM8097_004585 [Rhodosporidiobolus ruineniae]
MTLADTLSAAADDLLSLHSTTQQHSTALGSLERTLAQVALDPQHGLLSQFLTSQDALHTNITATLLDWLGRTLARQQTGQEAVEESWENLARALRLFQGLLLLHRPSQSFFARRSSLEYLLAILDMTRPSHPFSPALSTPAAFPSPVIFPSSPSFTSPNPSEPGKPASPSTVSAAPQLALAALDTLLCALVDRPENMRIFEEIGGLASAVKILKDKAVSQVVRIKVLEILYYYLLPESSPENGTPRDTNSSISSAMSTFGSHTADLPNLLASAADFVPQTPVKKPRPRSFAAPPTPSSSADPTLHYSSASSRELSPTRTPRQLAHKRSQSLTDFRTAFSSSTSTPARPLSASTRPAASSSSSSSTPSQSQYRPSRSSRPREPPISESDTDGGDRTDGSASSARAARARLSAGAETSGGEERTPRAAKRLSGLLSSAAASLQAAGTAPDASSARRPGHRRTQSAASASTSSSSRERPARLSQSGLPLPPPTPSRRTAAPEEETPRRLSRPRVSKGSSDAEEMPPPPLPFSPRAPRPSHARSRSLAALTQPLVPPPAPSSAPSSSSRPLPPPPSPRSAHPSRPPPPPSPSLSQSRSAAARARGTRTEDEKKELLRRVMPNVDALEERFRAMGLGPLV